MPQQSSLHVYTRRQHILWPRPDTWRYSRSIVTAATAILAASVVSCVFASDQRAAINATAGMFTAILCMFLAWQLLDRPWKIRLVAAVVIAAALAFAAKCWMLHFYEFDQTRQHYMQTRQQFWADAGKELDDPIVRVFESRLLSRDNGGFFFHSNLAGSYLVMATLLSISIAWGRFSSPAEKFGRFWAGASALIAALLFATLILTVSKSALMAIVIAALVAMVVLRFGRQITKHFRLAVIVTALLVLSTTVALITYGKLAGTLPTRSMATRWHYWQAGWQIFLDHPLRGIGPGNFGQVYLKYKLPQALEEVSNPHNFIVTGLTETGLLGGLAMIGLATALLWNLAYPTDRRLQADSVGAVGTGKSGNVLVYMIIVAVMALPIKLIVAGWQINNAVFAFVDLLPYFCCWFLGFVVTALHSDRFGDFDNHCHAPLLVNRGSDVWLAAAVLAFFLGNLVNFSLFEPSTAMTFFLVAAMALAARNTGLRFKPDRNTATLACASLLVLMLLHFILVLKPTWCTERALIAADSPISDQYDRDPTYRKLLAASKCDPYNAQLPILAAQRLMAYAQTLPTDARLSSLRQARDLVHQAIYRNPQHYGLFITYSKLHAMFSDIEPDKQLRYALSSTDLMRLAVDLNPTSRKLRIDYAKTLRRLAETKPNNNALVAVHTHFDPDTYRRQAIEQLQQAIKLDNALPAHSTHSLSDRQIKWINDQLLQLRALQTTSEPAR